jgi:hypothetical protein
MNKLIMIASLILVSLLAIVHGDGNLQQYKTARVTVSVKDFGTLSSDLLGKIKGSMINHVLSKKVNEKSHGVTVDTDGTEKIVLSMYLSEHGDHVVVRANKKPLFTQRVERFAKSTQTVSTLFWQSKKDDTLNKLCFKMHAPLPDTPKKIWTRILNFGAGQDGFEAKCSSQDSSKACKRYKVCETKKKWFVKFNKCVANKNWGSDAVFRPCSKNGAAMCYETKTGDAMKILLQERIWNKARAGQGNLLKKSFNFIKKTVFNGVRKEREKTMTGSGDGKLSMKTIIHAPRDESFDYEHVGKCIYSKHKLKFKMINKIPFGPPVDFMPCDMGAPALIEVEEEQSLENALSVEEQALVKRLESLTEVDMHTEKGMVALKGLADVLLGIGIAVGAVALIGLFFVVKLVVFFIVPILFVGGLCILASMI